MGWRGQRAGSNGLKGTGLKGTGLNGTGLNSTGLDGVRFGATSPVYAFGIVGCLAGAVTGGLHYAGPDRGSPAALAVHATPVAAAATTMPELATLRAREGRDARVGTDVPFDALLASPMLAHPGFVAEVDRWVRFWETGPSRWVPTYLERMTWFEASVDSVLAAHDLPWSLRYLPVIESGYSPTAVSRVSAVGLWQFMAPTGRDFGMRIDRMVDERRDPFKSTEAAAAYLSQLHGDFNSWFLALAAYNAGPERIRGILRRHAPGARLSDSLYWAVRDHLPAETRDFVPNLFGAMIVAGSPESHGYTAPSGERFAFDRVLVASGTSFEALAKAAGVNQAELVRLNPKYLRGVTPSPGPSHVRVPVGLGAALRAGYTPARSGNGGGG